MASETVDHRPKLKLYDSAAIELSLAINLTDGVDQQPVFGLAIEDFAGQGIDEMALDPVSDTAPAFEPVACAPDSWISYQCVYKTHFWEVDKILGKPKESFLICTKFCVNLQILV